MSRQPSFTIEELSQIVQCEAVGDLSCSISGVDDLENAASHQAAFLENPLYQRQLGITKAGLIVIHPKIARGDGLNYLISQTPSLTFQTLIELFIPVHLSAFTGIHPTAVIASHVTLGADVTIGPHAVIDQHSSIGEGTVIGAGAVIGAGVTIGTNCHIHANVVIREGSLLGNRVVIQPGSVIGSCGFGYHTDQKGHHRFLKQLGHVILEDDVEVGANTTIDRARFKTTRIRKGTKIDNLVQIGHQVELGEHNLIVSQVGISGSTKTGQNVVIGGQSGLAGHVTIADKVILAARSGVSKSVIKEGIYMGAPVMPRKEFGEHFVHLRNLGKMQERITALEEARKEQ